MADPTHDLQDVAIDLAMGTDHLPGREVLDRETLRSLNARSDLEGLMHFAAHLLVILMTGVLVHVARGELWWLLPAMVLHGFAIVTLFAPMHESVHMTPFRSRWLNKTAGWIAGIGSFFNSTYYRRYHHWHHRFTQDPERDPELVTPKPRTPAEYVVRLSGLFFWRDKVRDMITVSLGRVEHLPFVPVPARPGLIWSMRAQLALYVLVALAAIVFQTNAPLIYWLLPMLLGQPLMRAILIAEHTGCSEGSNGLTNTRTTLTTWPIRFFMWNMPYHAEHHLYPSIPCHALPQAHRRIRDRIAHLDNGYIEVNKSIWRGLSHAA